MQGNAKSTYYADTSTLQAPARYGVFLRRVWVVSAHNCAGRALSLVMRRRLGVWGLKYQYNIRLFRKLKQI